MHCVRKRLQCALQVKLWYPTERENMSNCPESQMVCENNSSNTHSCPMNGLDKLGKVLCQCCETCNNACRAWRDEVVTGLKSD